MCPFYEYYLLFNRNFRNYSKHYLKIAKKTPRKKRLSPLKIGRKELEDHTKTLLSKICPPRKGQRLRRTLLPYLTYLSKNCESPRTPNLHMFSTPNCDMFSTPNSQHTNMASSGISLMMPSWVKMWTIYCTWCKQGLFVCCELGVFPPLTQTS